jgi:probable F420-dependent oxidoreductase
MATQRPFRFGVQIYESATGNEWKAKARKAEDLGYDTLVIPDHIGEGLLAYAPALMAIAAVTTSLRVGTFVLDNDFRHPALVAGDAATVDLLSDGRFELGLGAGWDPADYGRSGIPFEPPGVRVGRMEESLHIIKNLFSDAPVTFHGRHYSVTNLEGFPKPVQRPPPPILIGGGGKRVLSIAAREADIVSIAPRFSNGKPNFADLTAAAMARKVEWIRHAASHRFDELDLNVLIQGVTITSDRQQVAAQHSAGWEMTGEELLQSPFALIGTVDQIIEALQSRREQFGLSYVVVFERDMDEFAPVVARLAGT